MNSIPSRFGDHDLHLFNEGTHARLYEKLGAHPGEVDGVPGVFFAVWAPDAERVSVVGPWNGWDPAAHSLRPRDRSGIWEGFVPEAARGTLYKFHLVPRGGGVPREKADPFGTFHEIAPRTASVVWSLEYEWGDGEWMKGREERNGSDRPISIYELHLGSWMRVPGEGNRSLHYGEIAPRLVEHVKKLGFTHVEIMPVMEHPFFGSWGYQITGFFAPTSRFGTPQDFMAFVDTLHRNGIGVILDWVPSHFATDAHGLGHFDGSSLYEHVDPRQGIHPDWDSFVFNYDRNEVRSFLLSNAMFWLDVYHADGLRVDAVASMLYLDYSRKEGDWIPNRYGGRENLGAVEFLRRMNEAVYGSHPDVQTIAEESTAWPMVSRPTYVGGLGFGMKWDMGWMHDILDYMSRDPVHRRFHHDRLTFRPLYAFNENFILPLSHDEVVHGKGSLLGRMPGDPWQRFANLRILFGLQFSQPGKKLLFMGGEFGQWGEWSHDGSLDWQVADEPPHAGMQRWVSDLNRVYRETPALYETDFEPSGFEWIDFHDADQSVVAFLRRRRDGTHPFVVVGNFTPVPRSGYRLGVPEGGAWREVLNSDAAVYGGSGMGNLGGREAEARPHHGRPFSLELVLPPLSILFLERNTP
jgi:1,4-alpha-glucan branching enzyme